VFACRIQRAGSFEIEECELGEVVPRYKYEVCLEEIDEILEEDLREPGPFFAGSQVSAADIIAAPFLERMAAHLPLLYKDLSPRPAAGKSTRFDGIADWFDAMDEQVPCYACRLKGRVETWQALLRSDPYLEGSGELQEVLPAVPDLPTKRSFDASAVWSAYAEGRSYLAPTPEREVSALIVRHRERLVKGASRACGLPEEATDGALRGVCYALLRGATTLTYETMEVALFLNSSPGGLAVPRDLGLIPAEALRALVCSATVGSRSTEVAPAKKPAPAKARAIPAPPAGFVWAADAFDQVTAGIDAAV